MTVPRLTDPYPVHLTSAERQALLDPAIADAGALEQAREKLRFLEHYAQTGVFDVEAGQTWAQTGKGIRNGQWNDIFEIVGLFTDSGVEYARTFRASTGRHTRVRLDRFAPDRYGQSTYVLVSQTPAVPTSSGGPAHPSAPIGDGDLFIGPPA